MKVTVLGSGISGLSAAFFAVQAGLKVHLITGSIGGLTSTIYDNGWEFDIGPQMIKLSPASVSILDIAVLLNLTSEIQTSSLDSDDKQVFFNKKLRPYSYRPVDFQSFSQDSPLLSNQSSLQDESIHSFQEKMMKSQSASERDYFLNVLLDATVLSYYSVGARQVSARSSNMTSSAYFKHYNIKNPQVYKYKAKTSESLFLLNQFFASGVKSFRFKGGWKTLTNSLISYLSSKSCIISENFVESVSMMKEVTLDNGSVYGFDFLVSSLNSEGLSKVMPGVSVDIPHANWSVLNLGYENRPKLEGFGYAVPGIENSKIFAVIFNYNCFKENKATVTVLGRGEYDEMIKELLIQTGLPYPSTGIGRILHSGSSIYSLGHYHNLSKLQNLPDWLSVIGHSFHHSGIPSCIIRSDESITRITSKNP